MLHLGAAEVEVAVLEADFFVGDGVFGGGEGRGFGVVEEEEFGGDDFDLAGGHVGVFEAGAAAADVAGGRRRRTRGGRLRPWRGRRPERLLSKTIWVMPVRSRRSRKMRLPWSRRRLTQPMRVTSLPVLGARRSPHMWVRCRVPRKSSVTIGYCTDVRGYFAAAMVISTPTVRDWSPAAVSMGALPRP